MKTQMGYKVVRQHGDRLYSAFIGKKEGTQHMRLEYKPFIRTSPKFKGTLLFGFLDLDDAIEYCTGDLIFRAKLYNPVINGFLSCVFGENIHNEFSTEDLINWFKGCGKVPRHNEYESCVVCTSITIHEQVYQRYDNEKITDRIRLKGREHY